MNTFVCFLLSCSCLFNSALSSTFEAEDVVPVRINGRISRRFWKRSEEQPTVILSAFGKDMTLNLMPDTSFLSPSFTIQRITAKDFGALRVASGAHLSPDAELQNLINRTEESEGHLRTCFYSGNVDHDPNSVVAVSLCSGIFGSFITDGREYLIEPKVGGGARGSHSVQQLHVIKRRAFADGHRAPLLFDRAAEESRAGRRDGESFTHGDAQREPRRRRFVSAPRFIETLVVADSTMTHFYGEEIKVRHHELILSRKGLQAKQTHILYNVTVLTVS